MKRDQTDVTVRQNIRYFSDDFKILISDTTTKPQEKAFHETLEIKYFYEGQSLVVIDSDVIIAECGDITIVNPYELHANVKNDVYTGKYFLVMVDLDFFAGTGINELDLRQLLLVKRYRFNHCIKNNRRLQQIILRIKEELDGKMELYRLVVSNLLSEFFALLIREELCEGGSVPNARDEQHRNNIIMPALQKIFCDYGKHITIEELAQLCNVSKYHFCRIFKRQMGMTVTQYIINYRISIADSMLRYEKQSIREIAAACGFGDLSYFYQCYKRVKGEAPGKARS